MTLLIPLVSAQAVAFWGLAPIMVLGALGMVFARKPVHSALGLAVLMISLAVQYAALDAPFLFVVQIIVYTGAILMLFLFVMMLVGVDASDSLVETIRGHRVLVALAGLGVLLLLGSAVWRGVTTEPVGLSEATVNGNVESIAEMIFTRYVFGFEATAALLITAALGAMVLAHGEQLTKKVKQREAIGIRMQAYANQGSHPGPMPNSGVYARNNAIAAPALLPDGTIAEASISTPLASRGAIVDAGDLVAPAHRTFAEIEAVHSGDEEELA